MENIRVEVHGQQVALTTSTFNGGEEHVKLSDCGLSYSDCPIKISVQLVDSSTVMQLLLVKDAVDRMFAPTEVFLAMGYVPYARQDRVCNEGEAHSIKVFCNLINSMNFDEVWIVDPHSDVVGALLNNVQIFEQQYLYSTGFSNLRLSPDDVLIIPDAGAAKKSLKVAKTLGIQTVVQADKVREISTGKLLSFNVYADDLEGKDCYIVDDICDGGGTFIGLAKILKEKNAGKLYLCVSHGIFSKGIDLLIENGFEEIYTTDSLPQKTHPKLRVLGVCA